MKLSIKYLLAAVAIVSGLFSLLASFGLQTFLGVIVLAWPSLLTFTMEPSTLSYDAKLRAIFVSSGVTLLVSLVMIVKQSSGPFTILIALFSIMAMLAAWFPQFLAIVHRYDAAKT